MPRPTPLIKGLFVNSHVNRLKEERGAKAVEELERRFGGRVVFKALEDVPVRDEVRLLEHILDMTHEGLTGSTRAKEAGRLHFRNFATTPLGRTLLASLPQTSASFKTLLCNSGSIARSILKHTNFSCVERPHNVVITTENSDYPIEHFEGFFYEWMSRYEMQGGTVRGSTDNKGTHRYVISGF